MKFKRKIYFKK